MAEGPNSPGGLFGRAHAQHDVIKTADWMLDLGPEGGVKGGEIVAKAKGSFTGK